MPPRRKSRPVSDPCDTPGCRGIDVWRVPKYESALCVQCRSFAREFDSLSAKRREVIKEMLRG